MPNPYTIRDWRSEKAVRSLFDRMGFSAEQSHRAVEGFRSELERTCAAPRTPKPTIRIQIQERGRVDEAFNAEPYEFQRYYAEDSDWVYYRGVPMDEVPDLPKVRVEIDPSAMKRCARQFGEGLRELEGRIPREWSVVLGSPFREWRQDGEWVEVSAIAYRSDEWVKIIEKGVEFSDGLNPEEAARVALEMLGATRGAPMFERSDVGLVCHAELGSVLDFAEGERRREIGDAYWRGAPA